MLKSNLPKIILATIILLSLLVIVLFSIPSLRSSVIWRIDDLRVRLVYALNPPEKAVFIPEQSSVITPTPLNSSTPTQEPTFTFTPDFSSATLTPTLEPTALPSMIKLEGIRYQDQHGLWNYCAPLTT